MCKTTPCFSSTHQLRIEIVSQQKNKTNEHHGPFCHKDTSTCITYTVQTLALIMMLRKINKPYAFGNMPRHTCVGLYMPKENAPKKLFFLFSIATNRYILSFCVLYRRRTYFFHRRAWKDNRRKEGCRRDPFRTEQRPVLGCCAHGSEPPTFSSLADGLIGSRERLVLGILLLYFEATYRS